MTFLCPGPDPPTTLSCAPFVDVALGVVVRLGSGRAYDVEAEIGGCSGELPHLHDEILPVKAIRTAATRYCGKAVTASSADGGAWAMTATGAPCWSFCLWLRTRLPQTSIG